MSQHRQRPSGTGNALLIAAVAAGLVALPTAPVLAADPPTGNVIHVAMTGSDTGTGTEAAPYRSVNKAAQVAEPGDTVAIHAGLYRELVEPARGGTDEASRITYTNAGDGEVVIKGSEEIDTWFQYSGDVWGVTIPNTFFGDWNPYSQCQRIGGGGCPTNWYYSAGDVYLDEEAYYQKRTVALVEAQANTWSATVDGSSTTIYANFDGANPNTKMAEINVRRQIFAPSEWGLGYITVRGLTFKHSANTYSDFPDAELRRQAGAVSVYGGLNWIIEQNIIINARTIAIDIGLSCDIWAGNRTGGIVKTHFHDTDLYGSHIVRGNYIGRAGQSGVAGVFSWRSQIMNNMIEDTNYRNEFSGAETAPIKVHYMNEGLIKGNYILNSKGGNSAGIWTDWGNQAVRVTGNIVMFSPWGYYAEAVHGPILVDNNVFIGNSNLRVLDGTAVTFAHNLFLDNGSFAMDGFGRVSYWFDPGTMDEHEASQNVQQFYWMNNLVQNMTLPNNATSTNPVGSRTHTKEGNAIGAMSAISYTATNSQMTLNFNLNTSAITGLTPVTKTRIGPTFRVGEEIPADVTTDFFGSEIGTTDVMAGPFADAASGANTFQLWPPTGVEIATPPAPRTDLPTNLSRNPDAVATASRVSGNMVAASAIDGIGSTRWSSDGGCPGGVGTAWITVNLGNIYNINRVVLQWEAAYGRTYEIQISDDGQTWESAYSTSNGQGGVETISIRKNAQYVRMQGLVPASQYCYSLYEFEIYGTEATVGGADNVAAGLPSSAYLASSQSNDGTGPTNSLPANDRTVARAFDGDTSTRWGSNGGDTEWAQADLGQPYLIDKVVLNWESAYADAYEVQVSANGTDWTTVHAHADATQAADHVDEIEFAEPVEGRFVRMRGVHAATAWGLSLYEFEVYGTKAPVSAPPEPVAGATVAKSTSYPVTYGDWTNGLLAGNGQQGIIVFGDPRNETVVFNDKDFFAARTQASPHRSFNTVAQTDLTWIRDQLIAGNYQAANQRAANVQGYSGGGEGSKHPGFKMTMQLPDDGTVNNYYRATDYSDGVIAVNWSDERGNWQRESFVSRPDGMTVQYLPAPAGTSLDVTLGLSLDDGMHLTNYVPTSNSSVDFLNLRVKYPTGRYDAGYEGVTRIVTDGVKTLNTNGTVTVNGASYVMLLSKTKRYNGTYNGGVGAETEWNQELLQAELAGVSDDYATLRARHVAEHSGIMDRVALDFGASDADRAKTNEQLLTEQRAASAVDIIPALYERLFYSGRYHMLASSGATAAPDLLGNWTGDSQVGWDGYYHLDANLNLQISGGNIGNMPEAMEGYFWLNKQWQDDFRTNATKLLGTRGMLTGGNTPNGEGLISNINYDYPYQYVTGGESWLLYPFWEYYQITGDTQFLEDEYYPLIRDMGDFYEDFLVEKDGNGDYVFAGSISPENRPSGGAAYPPLTVNSVYDISGAKFALSTLIETATELGKDATQIPVWQELLDNLPPYIINSDGALAEWAWPDLAERNQYTHRHSSGLMPVWPYAEITPETSQAEYDAASEFLRRKDSGTYENAGHGILHGALIAANLNNEGSVRSKLLRFPKQNYYFNSLATAHYNNYSTFCTDVANSVPTILMEMLAQSAPGTLEVLPALPPELSKGSIEGLLGKSQFTIDKLEWDTDALEVTVTLTSAIDQNLTLIERGGIEEIASDDIVPGASPLGDIARVLPLRAGDTATVVLTLVDPNRVNLAVSKPALASSESGTNTADLAFDGDLTTRWGGGIGDADWLQVDLGAPYGIDEVVLQWEDSYAKAYKIQTSMDGLTWTDVYTEDSSDGGTDSIGVTVLARYVRMQGVERSGDWGFSLYEMEIYGQAPSNLALGKASRTSNSSSGTQSSVQAFDGDMGTRWGTSQSPTNWIDVDLGDGRAEYFDVFQVAIHWEASYATGYRIQISPDGVNWTDVFTEAAGDGGTDIIDLAATTRFVRMQGAAMSGQWGYSIYEMEVYGVPHPGWVEKSALSQAVNAATALDPDVYTTSSWALAFPGTLIADATTMITDDAATQEGVDAAALALTTGIGQLVARGNVAPLQDLVDAVVVFLPVLSGAYTQGSVDVLSGALGDAVVALTDSADLSQGDVGLVVGALLDAVDGLVPVPAPGPDRSVLQAIVDVVGGLSNVDGRYTQGSWGVLQDAVEVALELIEDPDATQAQINDAVSDVGDALAGLVAPPDEGVLVSVLSVAGAMSNGNGRFTVGSWGVLRDAIEVGQGLLGAAGVSQGQIDAAVDGVVAGLAGLVQAPDKSVLVSVLATGGAKTNPGGYYTAGSWLALRDAVEAGRGVVLGSGSSQVEIDAAVQAVLGALAGLVVAPDLSVLSGVLAAAVGTANPGGLYTSGSWDVLRAAVAVAEGLLADPGVSQAQLDAAAQALSGALAGLVVAPDDSVLVALLVRVGGKSNADGVYTQVSWALLEDAVDGARAVVADPGAVQSDIDAAVDVLAGALAGLVVDVPEVVPPLTVPDGSVLQGVVDIAAGLSNVGGRYTSGSWQVLVDALAAARAVLADPGSSQGRIDEAVGVLSAGLAGLVGVVGSEPVVLPARGALVSVLGTADGLVADVYTPQSYDAVLGVVGRARKVLADPAASQEQIDAVVSELANALAGLRPRVDSNSGVPPVPVPVVAVAKVKAGQSAVALVRGKSVTVPVAVYFADRVASYSGALVWKSSNPRIAKVSSTGKITAVRAGKATVTATSKAVNGAGKKVSVKIRVAVVSVRPAVKATRVVAKVPKSLNVGQVAYVTGSYRSAKATGVKVSYKSSRPDVATVDKTGRITANSPGKTTLTVKAGPIAKKYTITTK